ncbi:hypothetical protein MCOR27_006007 [Pyricularia oryzae]|nr:hypothetical protein MCOR19_004928 [Pyricularia oryzae]KAI6277443.1 hypothetical protein MCOR27_006007 [Pyricularia oryzae]KAI6323026.1 hypothetical protein MCOR30_007427 [Pyricularia oryzae]KAI6468243.1 hypothetical protein MCOR15_002229 [Pyricularia oryzae]KAI6493551.1 hypothetical protein MCOR18_001424 [Pyricularia oryzae]
MNSLRPLTRVARAAATPGFGPSNAIPLSFHAVSDKRHLHHSSKSRLAAVAEAVPRHSFPQPPSHAPPLATPQLNIWEHAHKSSFYRAIGDIMELRDKYLEERNIFVDSRRMLPLLRALGVRDEDFEALKLVSDNLYNDPTLPFRRSRNGRFCFDFGTSTVRRLEFQPFALSLEEDFKRHDSGQVRIFDEVQDELQLNTAFQALMVFKALICHGVPTVPRPQLNYESEKWVCTLFNLRTVTTPSMLGEPALEGVHTDGVDHTMTTYLGSRNMAPGSAVTHVHDMNETTGVKFSETKHELLRGRAHHCRFLDTLLVADNERKHSLSPVYAVDPEREATRDMLIFFTRRPVKRDTGHVSKDIDSFRPHAELPMEVPLFAPGIGRF